MKIDPVRSSALPLDAVTEVQGSMAFRVELDFTGVTHVNNRFDANDLYELIVEKFPSSEYAVKATDQLTAMNRLPR